MTNMGSELNKHILKENSGKLDSTLFITNPDFYELLAQSCQEFAAGKIVSFEEMKREMATMTYKRNEFFCTSGAESLRPPRQSGEREQEYATIVDASVEGGQASESPLMERMSLVDTRLSRR